jgi:hypothetical protein
MTGGATTVTIANGLFPAEQICPGPLATVAVTLTVPGATPTTETTPFDRAIVESLVVRLVRKTVEPAVKTFTALLFPFV